MKPQERIASLCQESHHILARYYDFQAPLPDLKGFLLPSAEDLGVGGRVCFEASQEGDDFFVGLQFGVALEQHLQESSHGLTGAILAVLAEETSHFQMVSDASTLGLETTLLCLEALGEIDRFLVLMHWNAVQRENASSNVHAHQPIPGVWKNLHDICDYMFQGDRFPHDPNPLYFDAESLALRHLRNAFSIHWDATHFDFCTIVPTAQMYLQSMRWNFFSGVRKEQLHEQRISLSA